MIVFDQRYKALKTIDQRKAVLVEYQEALSLEEQRTRVG